MRSTAVRYLAVAAGVLYRGTRAAFRAVIHALLAWIDRSRAGRGVGPMGPRERRQARAVIGIGFGFALLVTLAVVNAPPRAAATPSETGHPTVTRTVPQPVPADPVRVTPARTSVSEPPEVAVPDVDVVVDRHVNLPDGALTGGYCRHKWWC